MPDDEQSSVGTATVASATVASATVDDVDAVTDLWVALAADQRRHGSMLLAESNRAAVREWVARSIVTGELLVARDDDGDVIGFVGFSLDREGYDRDRVRGTVSNLFVVPERRGDGIGTDLLDAAERALSTSGAETVALEALADNDRARAFYADRGYDLHRIELTKSLPESAKDAENEVEDEDDNDAEVDSDAEDENDAEVDSDAEDEVGGGDD